MTELRRMLALCVVVALTGVACGDDGGAPATSPAGSDDRPGAGASESADGNDSTAATDGADDGASGTADGAGGVGSEAIGSGTATIELTNGESFEFSILCALEPQQAAGSEILFSLVSYDEPAGLDVTQFGDDSFDGAANITIYESSTYDTLWEAASLGGSELTLERDGTSVFGTGLFYAAGDVTDDGVPGELAASCQLARSEAPQS